jgi:POT family proton-dependent oligopeptide transporter
MNPMKIILGIVGLIAFYLLFNKMLEFDAIGAIIFSSCIVLPALIITDKSLTPVEKQRIWVIYIIAFFVIFFWSAFEQAGASLTFFAEEQTDRVIFGWTMPASLFQIFNAAFIVILAPVAVSVWSFLAARGKEPASPIKQSLGLAFLALGYLYIAMGVDGVQPWEKVSMVWLVGLYLIHTIGELCLSPIGLSMVVKLAPTRFASLLMGVWFMSTATANKFAGDLSALYPEEVKKQMTLEAPAKLSSEVMAYAVSDEVFKKSPKESFELPVANLNHNDKEANNMAVTEGKTLPVSVYYLKLIRSANSKFNNALVSEDGSKIYSARDEKTIDVWNLKPVKPSFLGMQINDLKDFFMIFVYMAGAAAIVLFLISGRLLKMMHGVK